MAAALVGAVVAAPAGAGGCGFYDSWQPEAFVPCPEGEEPVEWLPDDENCLLGQSLVPSGDRYVCWEHDPDAGLPPIDEEEAYGGTEPPVGMGPLVNPATGPALLPAWFAALVVVIGLFCAAFAERRY